MSPTECKQERIWDVWEDLGGLPLSQHLHQKSDTVPGLDYHVSITLVGIWWIYVHICGCMIMEHLEWRCWSLEQSVIQRTNMLGGSWSERVNCHHHHLGTAS